jgi:hypothetical protein
MAIEGNARFPRSKVHAKEMLFMQQSGFPVVLLGEPLKQP